MIDCGISGHFFVINFVPHFQVLIVENFGILALFQVLIVDNFGILALLQVLIESKHLQGLSPRPSASLLITHACPTISLKIST